MMNKATIDKLNEQLCTAVAKGDFETAHKLTELIHNLELEYMIEVEEKNTINEEIIAKLEKKIEQQQKTIEQQQKRIELQAKLIEALQEKIDMYESANEPEVPDFTVEDIAGGFQLERGCEAIGIDNPIVDMYPLHLSEVTDEDIVIIEELRELMCLLDSMNEYGDQVCEAIIELNTLLVRTDEWRKQNKK